MIKTARLHAGMEQKDVAKLLGFPLKRIQEWEEGVKQAPPFVEKRIVEELERIAQKNQ